MPSLIISDLVVRIDASRTDCALRRTLDLPLLALRKWAGPRCGDPLFYGLEISVQKRPVLNNAL